VQQAWKQEEWCSASQLNVEKDDVVLVWADSNTMNGWIYAEHLKEGGGAGWLPLTALGQDGQQQLPPAPMSPAPTFSAHYAALQPATMPPVPLAPVQLQSSACWMRAKQACAATYDSQLPVQAGSPLLVHTDKVSADKHWVFAEALDAGARAPLGAASASRSGWVPMVCVEWPGSR
jgi:hypothetical protein